jgi:hypothetical protein
MTENLIQEKIAKSNWNIGDFFAVAVAKSIEEQALIPIVGNGTLKSGIIKGVAGVTLSQMVGDKPDMLSQGARYLAAAFVVDAVEDVVQAIVTPAISKFIGGASIQAASANMIETI